MSWFQSLDNLQGTAVLTWSSDGSSGLNCSIHTAISSENPTSLDISSGESPFPSLTFLSSSSVPPCSAHPTTLQALETEAQGPSLVCPLLLALTAIIFVPEVLNPECT